MLLPDNACVWVEGIAFSLCGVTVFYYTTKKAGWQSFFSEFSAKSKFYHFVKIKRKTM